MRSSGSYRRRCAKKRGRPGSRPSRGLLVAEAAALVATVVAAAAAGVAAAAIVAAAAAVVAGGRVGRARRRAHRVADVGRGGAGRAYDIGFERGVEGGARADRDAVAFRRGDQGLAGLGVARGAAAGDDL